MGVIVVRPNKGGGSTDGGAASDFVLSIEDEGVLVQSGTVCINFIGADVQASEGTGSVGKVNVYIPPPTFLSHWNTSDGSNGDQSVSESIISRSTARISTPSGGEGNPFKAGGWSNTNQDATLSTSASFTTPNETTGFGGNSTMTIRVVDADSGTLESYTTPAITGNNTHSNVSGTINVSITSYGSDSSRFKAKAAITVDALSILSASVLSGGRYRVEVTHSVDSTTDGSGDYVFNMDDVFLDTNPTTPSISGTTTIVENSSNLNTKHLSGLEYYTTGSQFIIGITDIHDLNENTSRTSANIQIDGSEYGISTLNHSPFGTGQANFSGWTNNHDQDGVDYALSSSAISNSDYRYIGPTANISATPRDTWNNGSANNSSNANILVDTFGIDATALSEPFNDEERRQTSDFNSGSINGNWNSENSLVNGEAIVFNSRIMFPNQTTYIRSDGTNSSNSDWTLFKPDSGGSNPDYTPLSGVLDSDGNRYVDYYRTFDDSASGADRSSFQITFAGTFASGSATADLESSAMQIFIRRVDGFGKTGPSHAFPLILHSGTFNLAEFNENSSDDNDRRIRESSSSGNTVNGTFAGDSCKNGIYFHIRLRNSSQEINSITITFFSA